MQIRVEHLAQIDEALQRRYCEEVRQLLREQFPQLVGRIDDPSLRDRILAGLKHARILGISTPEGTLAYIGLSLAAGPAFLNDPTVRSFFEVPGSDPEAKVSWLFHRVVAQLEEITGQTSAT